MTIGTEGEANRLVVDGPFGTTFTARNERRAATRKGRADRLRTDRGGRIAGGGARRANGLAQGNRQPPARWRKNRGRAGLKELET